jgi:hypothetical protein
VSEVPRIACLLSEQAQLLARDEDRHRRDTPAVVEAGYQAFPQ